jgi:hypothetical protein
MHSDVEEHSPEDDNGDDSDTRSDDPGTDTMCVEDVTQARKTKRARRRACGSVKVVQDDFEVPQLALFAKRCVRMATCIDVMYSDNPLFAWPIFSQELTRLSEHGRGDELVAALAAMEGKGLEKDNLVKFVNLSIPLFVYHL